MNSFNIIKHNYVPVLSSSIKSYIEDAMEASVDYIKTHSWYDANGDYLPDYDREVIVILDNRKVCFAHRPDPDGYIDSDGKKHIPEIYLGWNIPYVKYWLDIYLSWEK